MSSRDFSRWFFSNEGWSPCKLNISSGEAKITERAGKYWGSSLLNNWVRSVDPWERAAPWLSQSPPPLDGTEFFFFKRKKKDEGRKIWWRSFRCREDPKKPKQKKKQTQKPTKKGKLQLLVHVLCPSPLPAPDPTSVYLCTGARLAFVPGALWRGGGRWSLEDAQESGDDAGREWRLALAVRYRP